MTEDLVRKIGLQRGVHSYCELRTRRIAMMTNILLIVLPAFLTFTAFSELAFLKAVVPSLTEAALRLTIGLISCVLFLLGVLSETLGVRARHERHRDAIERYSELLREIREAGEQLSDDQKKMFNKRYVAIAGNATPLDSAVFRKAETYYLRNKALREARRKDPFANPWTIRRMASELGRDGSDDFSLLS